MILFFPSRNAPTITRQVKRMLLAIYTRVGGLCPGPPRATAAAAAAAAKNRAGAESNEDDRPTNDRLGTEVRGQALGRLGRRLGRLLLLLCRRCLFIAIADVDHLGHFGKILHAFAGALVQLARNDD